MILAIALAGTGLGQLRADTSTTTVRTVTQIADGVYTIRHPDAPDEFPQGNTTVIIGDDAVLVVDSCYLPSSAREDIAQIAQWTAKPVRYLVNTHWHYDHTMGNGTYAAAFPQLDIVAHTETRNQIRGYNPGWFERYAKRTALAQKELADGIDAEGKPLAEARRAELQKALAGNLPVLAEFSAIKDRAPNLSFNREMTIGLGNREVRLIHLGRGNTAGDIVVFLPRERILVAGDLLDHPVPYLGGGYPVDQVDTLQKLLQLDAAVTIPGHGDVLRGEAGLAHARLLRDFLSEVVAQVSVTIHRLGNNARNLELVRTEVEKSVDFAAWRQKFAGDNPEDRDFFDSFSRPGVVSAAFAQLVNQ